ncbi:PilZ domain-containing protein [Idiomarina seosinensis]|uniref:PilZ domain-containing protein n=1 Tax=Idiomarina seosinensis TaxID=281739 RepID=UPI00384AAD6E
MSNSPVMQTQQIGDFFTVNELFSVNLLPLSGDATVPDDEQFEQQMPELFKMASDMAGADKDLLEKLRLESQNSPTLGMFLEHMNQRMITMLGYLLRYEDEPQHRFNGVEFGGGGIRVESEQTFAAGQLFQAKLFLKAESLAIFCYLRCIQNCDDDTSDSHQMTLEFAQISEQDQEHLIRASLHAQSRQLKRRAQQRKRENSENNENT